MWGLMNACKGFGDPQIWDDTGLQKIHCTRKEEGASAQAGEPACIAGLERSPKA